MTDEIRKDLDRITLHEVEGEVCAFKGSQEIPIPRPPKNPESMQDWLLGMSLEVIEAGRKFYLDKWNWDSGTEVDIQLSRILEAERERRLKSIGLPGQSSVTINLYPK